jgi:PAS domain S-box-containing protein
VNEATALTDDELRARELVFREIIDSIPVLLSLLSPTGRVEQPNRQLVDYTGRQIDDLATWSMRELVDPRDLAEAGETFTRGISAGEPFDVVYRIRRFDGAYRWFEGRHRPMKDGNGRLVRWCVSLNDIDDRKRAEDALRESERQSRLALETIPTLAPSEQGSIVRSYGTNSDLEDRKRAEAQLAGEKHLLEMVASGRSLRDVLNAICEFFEQATLDCHCGIYPIDWSGPRFQYGVAPSLPVDYTDPIAGLPCSHDVAPCGMAAYEKIQVIAQDIHSDPRWLASSYRAHALEHGLRAIWSTPICSLDGTVLGTFCIYQRSPGTPSAHHQSLISHVTHIASIAMARSQAESALARSEAFLAEGQRISLTGSFAWRLDTNEITFSDELYRTFQFDDHRPVTIEQIGGRIHPEDIPLLQEKLALARAGIDDHNYDLRLRLPDGRIRYLRTVARVVPYQDGRLEYLGTIQDVTERRLSEDALANVRSELAHVTRTMSLGVLTASIAHEVNQPLSGIITNASTCQRMLSANPPNVDGALETVRRTIRDGHRASQVVARLRTLFRNKEVVTEAVDLNEATREVIALSGRDLQRRRIAVQAELDDELPSVSGDRIQLQQVILNLLSNASDAVKSVDDRPKQVFIRTRCDEDGAVLLTVTDTGVGVPAESRSKLFDAFYTTKANGMGIGLSVSRSIIESHHGRLWCEPRDAPGATFAFSIPVAQKTATK